MRVPSLLSRFNPRLHPLLALGIGLGVVALFLPSPAREGESHSQEEILARLTSSMPDFDHGPAFWLGEIQKGSALWHEAKKRCAVRLTPSSPNCELLASLESLVGTISPPAAESEFPEVVP